ncbi:MAG: YihY/virulence factor BrkB family protein [Ignavibacteriales bacterium]|nr:YihY/virulence factor BrkB family protein [Ignavibacteriales bacterium]
MKKKIFSIWTFIKEVFNNWDEDNVPRLGAALSFYTIFSITPLLIIMIAVIGFFYNPNEASGEIFIQIKELVGKEGALLIQSTVKNASNTQAGMVATIISLITLFIGATALLDQLQNSLNTICKVRRKKGRGVWGIIKDRAIHLFIIIIFGFFVILFLITGSILSILDNYIDKNLAFILGLINFILSSSIIFLLFAVIYKVLPDIRIAWRDVWIGALVTSLLFILGKSFVTTYIGQTSYGSIYGAAGSLAIFLIWVYYSSQILFLGAEFTVVYAEKYGRGIKPDNDAEQIKMIKHEEWKTFIESKLV